MGFSLIVLSKDYPLVVVRRLLIPVASLMVERGLPGARPSLVAAHGLSGTGSVDLRHVGVNPSFIRD